MSAAQTIFKGEKKNVKKRIVTTQYWKQYQRWNIISKNGYYILKNKETGMVSRLGKWAIPPIIQISRPIRKMALMHNYLHSIWVNHDLAYYHTIFSKLDANKLLTAVGNGITNTNVNIHDNVHNMTQKFYLRKETDGYYIIVHSFSGNVVTLELNTYSYTEK